MTCAGGGGTWPSLKPNSQCESRYFVRLPQSSLWICHLVCSEMPDSEFPCAFQNKCCIVYVINPVNSGGGRDVSIRRQVEFAQTAAVPTQCPTAEHFCDTLLVICEPASRAVRQNKAASADITACSLQTYLCLVCSFPGILFLTNRTPWRNAQTSGVVYHPKKPCCVLGP